MLIAQRPLRLTKTCPSRNKDLSQVFPLVLKPAVERPAEGWARVIRENRTHVEQLTRKYGSILFDGLPMENPECFDKFSGESGQMMRKAQKTLNCGGCLELSENVCCERHVCQSQCVMDLVLNEACACVSRCSDDPFPPVFQRRSAGSTSRTWADPPRGRTSQATSTRPTT